MGRKGIGKLSLFSIAGTVTVHSAKDGESHGFEMRAKDIESALRGGAPSYHPPNVGAAGDLEAGTAHHLDGRQPRALRPESLRERLARRFGIIGGAHGFEVSVDGTQIAAEDANCRGKLQYAWLFGGDGRGEFPRVGVQDVPPGSRGRGGRHHGARRRLDRGRWKSRASWKTTAAAGASTGSPS